jgi:hypothetical protein
LLLVGVEESFWARWLLPLLSVWRLSESRWQRRRFFCREEREEKRGIVACGEAAG